MATKPSSLREQEHHSPEDSVVMFQQLSSCAQASFWQEMAKLKVDVLGLDQKPLAITGTYTATGQNSSASASIPARLSVGGESWLASKAEIIAAGPSPGTKGQGEHPRASNLTKDCWVPGVVHNFNTDEAFRAFDKRAWMDRLGLQVWRDIMEPGRDAAVLRDPGRLARFGTLCFADIKRNVFIYWFAFPAVVSAPPFRHLKAPAPLAEAGQGEGNPFFSGTECSLLYQGLLAYRQRRFQETGDASCPPFFLILRSTTPPPQTADDREGGSSSLSLEVCPLDAYEKMDRFHGEQQQVMFGYVDPGTVPDAPGWPLRNFLLLLANRWGLCEATVVCYRGRVTGPTHDPEAGGNGSHLNPLGGAQVMRGSFVLHVSLAPLASSPSSSPPGALMTTGWEMHKGKYMPRRVDLSATMDPIRLAEQSVDLNLKLMRWRLLPALDIAALARTKCLLLGAGTLGCSVARGLLGWGVRTITLVDNGRVALSNPVRQSLFEYTDCADGGKPKALAAATALRRIFPGVVAEGHVMTIPMPGHPVSSPAEEASARREVELLDKLVAEHDVIFLLTDTRESRWLPTVLGAVHDKILVNAALGFDTFMVMRHGAQPNPPLTSVAPSCSGGEDGGTVRESKARAGTGKGSPGPADGDGIGCYFCNDVVAPDDSTKDRTLDQQCTVTRPGLAPVASALAVELMVALLHHPLRHRAPADGGEASGMGHRFLDDPDRPLGILPQQIRGYLAHFTTILPVTRAFQHCTGCAPAVIEAYKREGAGLVLRVCNEQGVLEEMTGLAQMRRETDALELSWSEDEDEEEEEELGGGGKEKEVEMGEKEQKGREKPTQEWNVKEEEKKSGGLDLALEELAIEHAGIRRTGGNCE